MNQNTPFLIKFNVDLIVGSIISHAGDAKAQLAKANEVLSVCKAFTAINSGDVLTGLTMLDDVLNAAAAGSNLGNAMAIQTLISWLSTKAAALQQVASGTLLGSLQTEMLNAVLAEAASVAQAYIAAAPKA